MALSIGGGISFGGGITIVAEGVVVNNTMTVASTGDYYGADPTGTYVGPIGVLTSDYFNAVYAYDMGFGTPTTYAYLTDGTYSGFTVTNGVIDSDQISYPRVFSINGTNYTFLLTTVNGFGVYINNSNLGFPSLIGDTLPISFDGASPSLTPNTAIISSYVDGGGMTSYGTSNGLNAGGGSSGPVFGTIVSDYINQLYYSDSGYTSLWLRNGTYGGAGGFAVNSGWIDSDTSGSTRVFTINGTNYSFTAQGSGSNTFYSYSGDAGNLQSNAGTTIPVIYDPDAQGGGANMVNGTITVGSGFGVYGWSPGQYGAGTLTPGMVFSIKYEVGETTVWFMNGTYGSVVVDDTTATIDGQSEVTITIDGVTEIGTLVTAGGPGPKTVFTGDVFSLQSKVGQSLTVEMDSGGGGGAAVTYTGGVDYSNGTSLPPGIFISGAGPSYSLLLDSAFWNNPAGFTSLYALTSGGTFDVTMPLTSTTSFTLTLDSTWSGASSTPSTTVTSSAPLTLGFGSQNVPSTVTIGGGPAPGGLINGTLAISNSGSAYGAGGPVGSGVSVTPAALSAVVYLVGPNITIVQLAADGTYDSVVIDGTGLNGSTNMSVTINSITQTGTMTDGGPQWYLQISGDPWSLQSSVGQTYNVSISN